MLEPTRVRTVLRLTSWSDTFSVGDLPSRVGMTVAGVVRVLCVGPGEWLFISHEQDAPSVRELLNKKPSGAGRLESGIVLVDITDGIAAFEARGPNVRDVLAQGCG